MCSYEAEQQRLMRLWEEVETEELSDDEEDAGIQDHVEERVEDSDTEQEVDNDTDENLEEEVPQFTGKDDITHWNKHPFSQRVRISKVNKVLHLPGVKGTARTASTPLDCWKLFFDDTMLSSIVYNTNKYIVKISGNYTRSRDAKPTNLPEIKALLGLLYLAGILKSARLNTDELWDRTGSGIDIFWQTMSLQRFRFLMRVIRTDDTDTRAERIKYDKLAPVRYIFDSFVKNCQTHYTISEYATIDEKLEAFRGRCSFRQYIPSKPAKYGIKIFALVDAKIFYTLNMEIYVGQQPEGPYHQSNDTKSVVLRMIQPISKTGRNVTTDNWFTSFALVDELLEKHKLTLVGTLKKNKKELPTTFVCKKKRPLYSSIFGYQTNKTLVSYRTKKNKNVLLISSMHYDDAVDPDTGEKCKPEMVTFYNKTKSGVDKVDEFTARYNCARNTRRWPMVVLYSLLNTAGINAHIIYCANNPNVDLIRRKFLRQLAHQLLRDHQQYRATLTNLPREIRKRRREAAEIPEHQRQPPTAGKRGRCENCVKSDSKTSYYCNLCYKFLCLRHACILCTQCHQKSTSDDNNDSADE